ncbi:uncharacterized protein B0H64DRAFT_396325 [Chaetomium fimeti]|uniref:Uncharacterized protein n=1 Tax=Chaetomium fimeti TaxID=1854472 RepID=A0AAE0LSF4_9PEZI|nr:hypothetical protein B0H64DRAFT_396325 [Chaetomium fimeti]
MAASPAQVMEDLSELPSPSDIPALFSCRSFQQLCQASWRQRRDYSTFRPPPGASQNTQNIQQLQREVNDLRADLTNARSWIQNLALRVPPEVLANNLWESVPRPPAPSGSVGSGNGGPGRGGGDSRTSTVSGPALTDAPCAHLGTDGPGSLGAPLLFRLCPSLFLLVFGLGGSLSLLLY